jgi:chemotaxis protein MotB
MVLAYQPQGDLIKGGARRTRMSQDTHLNREAGIEDSRSLPQNPFEEENTRDFPFSRSDSSIQDNLVQNSDEILFHDYPGQGGDGRLFGRRMPKTVHWSIPWSDLMMTMFIFFAVLFTYHAAFKEVPYNDLRIEEADRPTALPIKAADTSFGTGEETIRDIYDLTRDTLSHESLRSFASVDLVPDKAVRIILTGDLLFDTGMASLKDRAKRSLREIAEVLRNTPYMINLVGHTDDVPIQTDQFPSNWELSTTRACKVAGFLIDEMQIPAEKLYITGHASYQPLKPNVGEEGRAANRRVEIIVTKERPYYMDEGMIETRHRGNNLSL